MDNISAKNSLFAAVLLYHFIGVLASSSRTSYYYLDLLTFNRFKQKSVSNSSAKKTDAVQPDDERVESEEDKDEDTNEELQQEQEQEREPTKGVSEGEEVTEEEKRKTEELIATSGDIITPEVSRSHHAPITS